MKRSILHIIIATLVYIGIASSCNNTEQRFDYPHNGQLPLFADSLQSQIKPIKQIGTIQKDSIDMTQPIVMKGWFYLEDITSKSHTIFGAKDLFILKTTSNGGLHFNQPEIHDAYIDSLSISPFEWNHYAIKINRPEVEVYLNGKCVANLSWVDSSRTKQYIKPIIIGWKDWNNTAKGYTYGFHGENKPASKLQNYDFAAEYGQIIGRLPITANLVFYHTFDNKDSYWHVNQKQIHYVQIPKFAVDEDQCSYARFDTRCSFHIATNEIYKSLTIACRIRQDVFYRDYGALVSIGEYIALRTSNNGMYATIPQVRDFYTAKAKFAKNKWVHLAMTYIEKEGVTYYINGKKCDFLSETRTLQAFKDILVGKNGWNNSLIADLDNLFIWSRALSESEVAIVATTPEKALSGMVFASNSRFHSSIVILVIIILIITYTSILYIHKRRQLKSQRYDHNLNKQEELPIAFDPLHDVSNSNEAFKENVSRKFKDKLDDIITENLSSSEFQIKELAAKMGVSRTILYNQCSEFLNESPKQYIRNVRLDRAKVLLTETDKPIVQIMDETGFESRAYFAKCIKERFGVTPAALRQIP